MSRPTVQIVFDLLLITALVYISGGIGGPMYFLYIFPIIAAGLVLSGRAGLPGGLPGGHLFGVLADGMYYGLIPYFGPDQCASRRSGPMLYTIFLAWGSFSSSPS